MKKILKILFAFLIITHAVFTISEASSFSKDSIGTTGGTFLKLGKGVRAIGMGEAYAGVSDNLDAIYWNPAGLNNMENIEISAMHSVWFENIFFDYISAACPTRKGVFGFSVNYLGMDKIDKYYNTGKSADETYSPYDLLAYISYANKIEEQLFGINIKYIQSVIDNESASAVGLDLGYMKKFMDDELTFGGVIQNIGTELRFNDDGDPLPLNIKVGASYKGILKGLLLSSDVNFPIDNIPSLHIGAEYGLYIGKVGLMARTGYKTTTITDIEPLAGLSAGGGVRYSGVSVDYAWVPYGKLGNTHRISLSYIILPAKKSEKETKEKAKRQITPKEQLRMKRKYFMRGHRLFVQKKYRESIKVFKKVIKIDPQHYESMKYIERALEALNK